MKPVWIILFIIVAWIGLQMVFRSAFQANPGWDQALADARADARTSNKPLVLYFTADWCPPCQEMKRTTWTNSQVQDALKKVVFVTVDVDQWPAAARQFDVSGIPTLIRLQENGEAESSLSGLVSPMDFLAWIGSAPSDASPEAEGEEENDEVGAAID